MSSPGTGRPATATATAPPPAATPAAGTNQPAVKTATAAQAPATPPASSTAAATTTAETPRALRWWTFGTALACVLFAVTGLLTMLNSATTANHAANDAEQLIRVQSIRANLLRADALATNAFLIGGLEPEEHRAAYDEALQQTSTLITKAAAAQPHDQEALAQLNQAVTDYAAAMEQARANNRQGFPVGEAYLNEASAELRETAIPLLDALVSSNHQRALAQLGANEHAWFEVVGLGALAVLVVAMVWTARRFHRVINPGMAIATALVLVTWIGGMSYLGAVRASSDDVRSGELTAISAVGHARAEANEAKVQESLRLIARGSGEDAEAAWEEASEAVSQASSGHPELAALWEDYVAAHREMVDLDESGQWQDAVDLATETGEGSPNATFTAFDNLADEILNTTGSEVREQTGSQSWVPYVLMVLCSAALVAAGVSSAIGLRARLREYL